MSRPLYKAAAEQPAIPAPNGNAGLWFDKFCNTWRVTNESWSMSSGNKGNPKLEWIQSLAGRGAIGAQNQIEECALRSMRLIDRRGGRAAVFTTESRFVTGLGRSHPVENGFAWHSTLGTPYLPGSSVKGLVRSWAKIDADPHPDEETLDRLLGKAGQAGSICFLDAVPVARVQLEADVMTPHYAGWSENEPPGDWHSPNPIPFLTTAAGASFLFGFVPCRAVADDDLCTVSDWLRSALAYAGGGSKTAVGYGRFRHDDRQTRDWMQRPAAEARRRGEERERQEAAKTPEGRWLLKIQGRSEAEILELVRVRLGKKPLEDPRKRRAFAQAVQSKGLLEQWRQGRKQEPQTNVGKKKLKERARLLDDALAGNNSHETG